MNMHIPNQVIHVSTGRKVNVDG